MKATIDRAVEKRGIFRKQYHALYLTLEFSHEEKAIIKQAELENAVFYTRKLPPDTTSVAERIKANITVKTFLKGTRVEMGAFGTATEAAVAEDDIERACKQLKQALDNSTAPTTGTKSFDL